MTRKFTFFILALFALISGPGWGQAPVNTVLWGENFAHFGTKTPSAAGTGTGTTIYDNASITYTQSSTNTKGYNEKLAGGTAPELLLSKSNQTWTISGIKSGAAKEISLTFLSNKKTFSLTCSSDDNAYTVSGSEKSWTLTLGEGKTAPETFNITLKNTGSDNARIDDVVLKVTEAGGSSTDPSITCADITDVPYQGLTNATAAVTFNNAEGWTPSVTCDGTIVTTASLSENTVTYSVSENTSIADRTGSFTITLSKEGENNITKVVSVTQKHLVVDYAELPFSYDDGKDNLPVGLTQSGLGSDYSSSPKMKFDGNGDYLILKINETPGILNYTIKGNGFSEGTFKLQTSVDGETYTDKKTYTALGNATTETITDLDASVRYIKWIYTNKSNGNVALGDIQLEKSASVATPTFTPAGGPYYEAQNVTIECETEGAAIYYTIDGSTPTNASTLYTSAIAVSETTTIKAIAYVGNDASNVATAVYTIISIPTYASLAELIDAGEPTTEGTQVNVTLTDETITGIFTTTQGYRNGIFLQVGEQEIEIYCHDVPEEWVIGGKVSGTLEDCTWKLYGDTWELCPNSWDALTYTAPQLYRITIDIYSSENVSVETSPANQAAAGTEVTITATCTLEHYHVSEIQVIDENSSPISVDENGKFTMPESDVTIYFVTEEDNKYFVTYLCNSIIDTWEEIYEGPIGELREPTWIIPEGFTFAGWSTSMASTTAITETFNVTETTYLYAIFARVEGGSGEATAALTNSDIIGSSITNSYSNFSITNTYGTWSGNGCKQGNLSGDGMYFLQLRNNATTTSYLKLPVFPGNITSIVCEQVCNTTKDQYTGNIYFRTEADNNADAIVTATSNEALDNVTLNIPSGYNTGYIMVSAACRIYSFTVTYQSGVTKYYTRVYSDSPTIESTTEITDPSVIPSGATLTVYGLTNHNAANLVIDDGGQLVMYNSETDGPVLATVRKNITGYGAENTQTRDGYYLVANPTAIIINENGEEDEYDALDGCAQFDLYSFNPTEALEWRNIGSTSQKVTFERNVGYLFASANNTTVNFRGYLLPAGEIEITLVKATEGPGIDFPGFNLIGNPYTCNAYPTDEDDNFMPFYKMNEDGSELELVENVEAIAPCQGFFVEANANGDKVTISTTAPEPASLLSLSVSQNRGNVIDRAIVNFNGNNDLHKFMMNPAHTNISLAKNGEEFAAVSTSSTSGEMPVNFKAEKNGTYTITVNTENVDAEYLHLIDNMTGMDVDLLASTGSASYTFEAKTSDYASRFKLVFGVNNTDSESSDSNFAYMSDGNLVIDNIEGQATLQIVDELGRVISTETVNGSYNKALNLKAGLYIINLNGMTQKIVVE